MNVSSISGWDVIAPLLSDSLWRASSSSFGDKEGIQMKRTSNNSLLILCLLNLRFEQPNVKTFLFFQQHKIYVIKAKDQYTFHQNFQDRLDLGKNNLPFKLNYINQVKNLPLKDKMTLFLFFTTERQIRVYLFPTL